MSGHSSGNGTDEVEKPETESGERTCHLWELIRNSSVTEAELQPDHPTQEGERKLEAVRLRAEPSS
jgi:hypothetical protein